MRDAVIKLIQGVIVVLLLAVLNPVLTQLGSLVAPGFHEFVQGLLVPREISENLLRTRLHILHVFEFLGIAVSFGIAFLLYNDGVLPPEKLKLISLYCGTALLFWAAIFIATITFLLGSKPLIPVPLAMTFLIFMDLFLLYFLVQESGGPLGSIFSPFYPAFPLLTIQFVDFPLLYALLLPLATLFLFGYSIWKLRLPTPMFIGHITTMAIPVFLGTFIAFYNQPARS